MHRSYRPVKPTHSKLLQRRWDEAYYEEHRRRVAAARAEVDTRPPPTYIHLHLKMKKLQMEEERMATIDRDNRILLQKMSDTSRTQGRVDHRNSYESRSLNYERRARELMRITKENQELLKRLDASRPKYDREVMDKDWQANLRYMNQISIYPENWWLERSATTMTAANKSKSRRSNHKDSKVQRSKSVEQPSKERKASAKTIGNENSSASKKSEE